MVDLHGQYERIREEINNAIQEVLDTTAFINGPQVKTFAQHLAEYNQVEHVVPCANGNRSNFTIVSWDVTLVWIPC